MHKLTNTNQLLTNYIKKLWETVFKAYTNDLLFEPLGKIIQEISI